MTGEIVIAGAPDVEAALRKAREHVVRAVRTEGMERAAAYVHTEAVRNAPRSPTKAQFSATLKRKKKTDRKNFFPGGLEKSIEHEVKDGEGVVFVRENSYAGKYARRIHDEKGKTWRNRGPGTIAKGERADEKFIERAMDQDKIGEILEDVFTKAVNEAANGGAQ